jgi:malonate-semialdehyde dehydrogenase (acetylating)/methylmalonate-semialdehyde dehydrogenase
LITSYYGCTGQRCLSGAILAPVGDVADELLAKFMAAAKAVKLGEGLDEKTGMGPVVSAAHKQRVLGYIEKGIAEGAKLVLDGRDCKVKDYPNGFFVGPTIFDNVTPTMTIAREEIFGPVVSIVRCKNLNEAVELINTRGFANAACLYTSNGGTAREFKYKVKPSMIGINIGIAAPMSFFPFGGAGQSMFGDVKGHGQEIFQFFTDTKVVIERWL